MKLVMKPIALLLAAASLAFCLTGCGSEPPKVDIVESPAPTAETTPSAAPSEAPEETADPEAEARQLRYKKAYETYAPDTVVLTLGDTEITWEQYFSWIYDIGTQLEDHFDFTDWNAELPLLAATASESTPGAYVTASAKAYTTQLAAIRQKSAELGIELSAAQRETLQATLDGYTERFGGQDAMEKLLAEHFLSMDYYIEQNEAIAYIDSIYESLYGAGGVNLPEEDAVSYLKDLGYLYAKHILFTTVDDNQQPLSDDAIAEKRAEAESVLAQLQACPPDELPELFDSLMQQYSEDPGMLSFPDGYYFQRGEMVQSFEDAVLALEENGISDLVESDYGFHIIYCPPMRAYHLMGYDNNSQPYSPQAFAARQLYDNVLADWFADAEQSAVYAPGFESLDLNELLGE